MNIIPPTKYLNDAPPLIVELAESIREKYNADLEKLTAGSESLLLATKKDFTLRETRTRQNISIVSDGRMEIVWQRLEKYHLDMPNYVDPSLEFYGAIQNALRVTEPLESLTPKERDHTVNMLSANLMSLSNQLNKLHLIDPVLPYISDDECTDLNMHIVDKDVPFSPDYHGPLVPFTIPDLLERYANQMTVGNYNSNTLIKRPSRNSDGLLYFSRSMGQYNLDTYGKYLSDTISVIASVFFPDQNTSPDKIKASIKSMTP